jgi:hypothetical protein
MARQARTPASPVVRTQSALQAPLGSVRECLPYADEQARHRVVTADGHDYVVATTRAQGEREAYVTGAYPVNRGYLVMVRQPLCELRSRDALEAAERHEQLVRVLAEAGVQLVRARRALAARHRSERLTLVEVSAAREDGRQLTSLGAEPALALN